MQAIRNTVTIFILALILGSGSGYSLAQENDNPYLTALIDMQVPNPLLTAPQPEFENLILSYAIPENAEEYQYLRARSWSYDNALTIIALSAAGECEVAQTILSSLLAQLDDDSFIAFDLNLSNTETGPYFTGTQAWVLFSITEYNANCDDSQFLAQAELMADAMLTLQDEDTGSLRGSRDVSWYSTEHNISAYFALNGLSGITQNPSYQNAAEQIQTSLMENHYDDIRGCFMQGIGDTVHALDTATLGALFFITIGDPDRALSCLDYAETFRTASACSAGNTTQVVRGFKPYKTPDTNFVWLEGTLQLAVAYAANGNIDRSYEIVREIQGLHSGDNLLLYACHSTQSNEFAYYPSAASTAWMAIFTNLYGIPSPAVPQQNSTMTVKEYGFTVAGVIHDVALCNTANSINVFSLTDQFYIQPNLDSSNIPIVSNCSWQTIIQPNPFDRLSIHVLSPAADGVEATYEAGECTDILADDTEGVLHSECYNPLVEEQ